MTRSKRNHSDATKIAWREIYQLKAPTDSLKVCESATELRRVHPDWSPRLCWENARDYHSIQAKEPSW